ncbi:hypothetical protein Pdw03_0983 [Penicillium digitatum]|uniref:Uncharacterized protein n=1 Tax=Penicillium digitatum TaxID=36651 RepID=A0A7T7BNB1_PENDI|nr:hypothetical protein PDIDSM_7340 [Penicillium digitatum]QQK46085.1 hypothetical protein Pdw03_0983 [Penicillium digitatum]
MASTHKTNLEAPEQTFLPGNSNTVALECVEELHTRMKFVERSSIDQSARHKTVRKELDEIFARSVVVETEIQRMVKQGHNKAAEGQKTSWSLRRGNND